MHGDCEWCCASVSIKFNSLLFLILMSVMLMVFCSSCGKELPEGAYFCPKCGVKTSKGAEAGISSPVEDLKDAFSKMGEEIEKAFTIAGRELDKAFKRAREEIREATTRKPVVCSHCGEKNSAGARFCYKCGKKLD